MNTDWRGKIRYEVRIFPFGIGFSQRKSVCESLVVVIFYVKKIILCTISKKSKLQLTQIQGNIA